METHDLKIDETVPASRKLQASDAETLLASAHKMIACKGKKGTKEAMIAAALAWLRERGIQVDDLTDNEADAIMVAVWASENLTREDTK